MSLGQTQAAHASVPPIDMSSKQPPTLAEKSPSSTSKSSSALGCLFKAVCAAAALYILFGMISKTLTYIFNLKSQGVDSLVWEPWGPREEDGRVLGCAKLTPDSQTNANWDAFPLYSSTNSFYIPTSSEKVFVFSRGSYGHGTVRVELSNSTEDKIEIEVVTRYRTPRDKYHAQVCHLDREKGGQGIGIYTPRRIFKFPHVRKQISFDVTIRLPRSGSVKNPLVIHSLETNMGIWRQEIGSLEDRVTFKSLSLSSSNAGINTQSVSAENVRFKTSNSGVHADVLSAQIMDVKTGNGRITGSYNVSNSLVLKTSNAAITVTLRMENNDGNNPTYVDMETSNGQIGSSISLVSTNKTSAPSPAAFSVKARTSNSPLSITFTDAPTEPFAQVSLNARTSNSPAHTKLHATYEGSLSLKTSLFTPSVVRSSDPTDPSGKGRHRKVDIQRIVRGVLDARVWWGDDDGGEGKGKVIVTTSNSPNVVDLN